MAVDCSVQASTVTLAKSGDCAGGTLVSICVEAVNQLQAFKVVLHLWKHCCDTSKGCIYVEPAQPSSVAELDTE